MAKSIAHARGAPGTGNAEVIIHLPPGAKLCNRDHHRLNRVYLLKRGRVRLARGDEAIVEHLTPGNFFGEDSLLRIPHRREVAKSLSPVDVVAFRSAQLLDRVQQDRRFALRLLRSLALRLGQRGDVIRDFVAEPAERRLVWLLFRLAPSRPVAGWVQLHFSPSNSELARTIGTTRSRISHFMQHLRQMGCVERRPELWVRREELREFLGINREGESSQPRRLRPLTNIRQTAKA
jgi:CRP-like cAMP-binding protein